MQVSEILRVKGSTLFTIAPSAKLSEAVLVMAERDIGSLVVMEGGKLVGVLTFREILRLGADRIRDPGPGSNLPLDQIPIHEAMNAEPTVVAPDTEVTELRRTMVDSHQRYFPVMDDKVLMGVVSFHDVARAVLEEQSYENKMLKAYIRDWPGEEAG